MGFPSPALVEAAAALFPGRPAWAGEEGPRPRLIIGPGVLTLTEPDLARRERSANRHRRADIDYGGQYVAEHGCPPAFPPTRDLITDWSARSRSRMMRVASELDWSPLTPPGRIASVVTLTAPGDWRTVWPTHAAYARDIATFRRRYQRAWGVPLAGLWKREFQRRGAPHFAIAMLPPTGTAGAARIGRQRAAVGDGLRFKEWLSAVWADVVAHPDPEERRKHLAAGTNVKSFAALGMTDPKRVAIYFLKHGQFAAKEYQNVPPPEWAGQSVGRFWGVWGLAKATAEVEVTPADMVTIGRTLRRLSAAQGVTRQVRAPRPRHGRAVSAYPDVIGLAGAMLVEAHSARRKRRVRRRAVRLRSNRGFLLVNDGPSLAGDLARYVAVR